jgi:hypothetical protein
LGCVPNFFTPLRLQETPSDENSRRSNVLQHISDIMRSHLLCAVRDLTH